MSFFDQLHAVADEQKRKAFALDYVCRVYGLDAKDVCIPEQGEQTFTFIIGDRVIRLARSEGMSKMMGQEVEVLNTIEVKTDFKTPKVLDYRPDQNNLVCISRLAGQPLSHREFSAFGELGSAGQEEVAQKMGAFLGQMHKAFPQSDVIDVPWREEVLHKINLALQQEIDPQKRARLNKADQYVQTYGINDGPYVMLHGDLHPGNVLFDKTTGEIGIIDFGSAKKGLAHRDFVKIRRSMSEPHYNAAIEGYEKETGLKIDRAQVDIATDVFEIAVSGRLFQQSEKIKPARSGRHPAMPRIAEVSKARR